MEAKHMIDLKANPFFLDDESIRWVEETKAAMSTEEKLQQLFFTLLTYIGESSAEIQSHDAAAEIFAFLNDHYKENLCLTDIAEHFSFHPSYVIRLLKKRYQKTPGQIIQQLRLEKAAQLLTASDSSVQMIAYETGFNDGGYFTRLFKRHYGVTPHQCRNK
jgi:AraC-like DNA-binding protein